MLLNIGEMKRRMEADNPMSFSENFSSKGRKLPLSVKIVEFALKKRKNNNEGN